MNDLAQTKKLVIVLALSIICSCSSSFNRSNETSGFSDFIIGTWEETSYMKEKEIEIPYTRLLTLKEDGSGKEVFKSMYNYTCDCQSPIKWAYSASDSIFRYETEKTKCTCSSNKATNDEIDFKTKQMETDFSFYKSGFKITMIDKNVLAYQAGEKAGKFVKKE